MKVYINLEPLILRVEKRSLTVFGIMLPLCLVLLSQAALAAGVVAPGKIIKITVPRHPEFTQVSTVGTDGTVDYPLLSGVPLDGLTAADIRQLLLSLLLKYDREPEVFVVITEMSIVRVQVYGAVDMPGQYSAPSPLNIQQAVSMAGGVTGSADPTTIRILRSEKGGRREIVVNFTGHFFADSLEITPNLADGDVVIVPVITSATSVSVFGAVNRPGEVFIAVGDNIYDSVNRAGGLAQGADSKNVTLHTKRNGKYDNIKIDLRRSIKRGLVANLPKPYPGDILIVPYLEEWKKATFWLSWLQTATILISTLLLIRTL